jgi:hypothetical protein
MPQPMQQKRYLKAFVVNVEACLTYSVIRILRGPQVPLAKNDAYNSSVDYEVLVGIPSSAPVSRLAEHKGSMLSPIELQPTLGAKRSFRTTR